MKAIVFHQYGSTDVLKLEECAKPSPGDNEVLVKVFAASVNDWDWQLLQGIPFANRVSNGFFKPKNKILGCDIAGRIEAVGKNVKQFHPGDEVYGDLCENGFGTFAEYVCAPENALVLKPVAMPFEQAAAIPQAAMLAVQGLIDNGKLKSGQKLLINGAGGGVGTFGVQIAKLYDAEVTGVDSTAKLDIMRSSGFDHVLDYTKEDFTKNGQHYDLILDNKSNRSMFNVIRSLNPNGTYVTTGGESGRIMQAFLFAPLISLIYKKKISVCILKPNKDLAYINQLFNDGKLKSVIDKTYRLEDVPKAIEYFGEGQHKGKIVITINQETK